ncbi:MAG: DNA (cytosine-5-)-methyltransferase [Candidatus Electrothrix sp. Rat3]|nr:DNA (cytosine-5-)-methyltransferase [Candidatus Electrothrix rattekaaiensis]
MPEFTFIDLFSGIGGFHIAASHCGGHCVMASEIDQAAREAYTANFGLEPRGDVSKIEAADIPFHDMLCAGFPCQPFSIIGNRLGFDDMRGTLFFEIIRILKEKMPPMIVLENVKQLSTHNKKKTLARIIESLNQLGYKTYWKVLNALDCGLPQKRERVIIVGFTNHAVQFSWPEKIKEFQPISDLLESNVDSKYFASDRIRQKRKESHTSRHYPAIWHENKSGNVSSYPFSCALRAGASYNYLLVNGERRLTPREMLRLQGFPDSFRIVCSDSQTRKQAGNAVPVPMIENVMKEALRAETEAERRKTQDRNRTLSSRRTPGEGNLHDKQMACL